MSTAMFTLWTGAARRRGVREAGGGAGKTVSKGGRVWVRLRDEGCGHAYSPSQEEQRPIMSVQVPGRVQPVVTDTACLAEVTSQVVLSQDNGELLAGCGDNRQ